MAIGWFNMSRYLRQLSDNAIINNEISCSKLHKDDKQKKSGETENQIFLISGNNIMIRSSRQEKLLILKTLNSSFAIMLIKTDWSSDPTLIADMFCSVTIAHGEYKTRGFYLISETKIP